LAADYFSAVHDCEAVYLRGFANSGTYQLYTTDGYSYTVYCVFNGDRSGFAFPSKSSISSNLLDLEALRISDGKVTIYFWVAADDANWHKQSVVRPVAAAGSYALVTVNTSWTAPLPGLDPAVTGPYLYASINGLRNDVSINRTLGIIFG
jgi:hypothetical protein